MRVLDSFPWVADCFKLKRPDAQFVYAECPHKCPGHKSGMGALRLWVSTGKVPGKLCLHCWAGCDALEVLRSVKRSYRDCYPAGTDWNEVRPVPVARYSYHDEAGALLYQKVRLEPGHRGTDKTFRQRMSMGGGRWAWGLTAGWYAPGRTGRAEYYQAREGDPGAVWVPAPRMVLYRLYDLITRPGDEVILVAGEKDVDTLRGIGMLATTGVEGESRPWPDAYSDALAGRDVAAVEDRDSAGPRHANEVVGSLIDHGAASVRRVRLPDKDATAFVNRLRREADRPLSRDELRAAVEAALAPARRWVSLTT